jgi:uroporphyrin-III C-methyltransferase / precorrin-2 dehydrogenase / sirohydrochlorin ferrochelatase
MPPLLNVSRPSAATSSGRMAPLARLPVFLALKGKRAVLAGGSAAAAWKAELLSAAGARVDVYAEEVSEEMRAIAGDPLHGLITVHERAWAADDINSAAIAVGAFTEDAAASVFVEAARAGGVPVNIIDKPAFCDFAFGAIVNRSPLVIGISTDGAAPVFAQAIRAKLETLLPRGFAIWAAAAQSWRSAVRSSGLTLAARRKFWQLFAAHAVIHAEREPGQADFDRLLAEVLRQGPAIENGSVTLVNAGPGDPELLTLRAVRALQSADIILFDDRVSREVLDFARREARKLLVGSAGSEAGIDALMVGLALGGKRVVRLRGGDGDAAVSMREFARRELASVSSSAAPGSSATRSGAAA